MLDLERDPKLMWALANRDRFPVDVNRAEREMLLRIPGLGARSVDTLIAVRRVKAIRLEDLQRLARSVKRLQPFVITQDWRPGAADERLAAVVPPVMQPVQLSLF